MLGRMLGSQGHSDASVLYRACEFRWARDEMPIVIKLVSLHAMGHRAQRHWGAVVPMWAWDERVEFEVWWSPADAVKDGTVMATDMVDVASFPSGGKDAGAEENGGDPGCKAGLDQTNPQGIRGYWRCYPHWGNCWLCCQV